MKNKDNKIIMEEYAARENEIASRCVSTLSKRPPDYEVSILDFYPEFDLKMPYTSAWQWDLPIWLLLPYYSKIIVPVYPYSSKFEFERRYGLGIERLLQLESDGKVALRIYLPTPQLGIPEYSLQLYEECSERNVPTFQRSDYYMRFIGGNLYTNALDEAKSIFCNRLKEFAGLLASSGESIEELEQDLQQGTIFDYANLKGLGYSDIIDNVKLLASFHTGLSSVALNSYSTFLVGPIVDSLEGIHLVRKEDIRGLNNISDLGGTYLYPGKRFEVFPVDVGKSLIDKARLVTEKSLDDTLDVYPDFEKARDALKALEEEVDKRIESSRKRFSILAKKDALEEIWREIYSSKESQSTRDVIVTLGIVGAAIGGSLGGGAGLLASIMGGLIATDRIAKPISGRISRFGKSNHIIKVLDFIEKVDD